MTSDLPPLTEFATRYIVCALPVDHIDFDVFALTVEWRGDSWAVCRGQRCYNIHGERDLERLPSERTDDWLTQHRFTLDQALTLARTIAPTVTVNGWTVEAVLKSTTSHEH